MNLNVPKSKPELTIKERVFRRLAISKVISKLELPVALDENYEMEKILLWYDANLEQNTKQVTCFVLLFFFVKLIDFTSF